MDHTIESSAYTGQSLANADIGQGSSDIREKFSAVA